jgi:hypothetical protein
LQFLAINQQFLVDHPERSIALVDQSSRSINQSGSEEQSTFFSSKNTANPLTRRVYK